MIITHFGAEFFKVSFGDTTLAFNPIAKDSKLKGNKFGADIALISLNDPDMNGADQVAHGERVPFVIDSPGEYEIGGMFVRAYPTTSMYGGDERINTVFFLTLENMKLCYLGALGASEFSEAISSMFDEVDVLFIPIGGEGVLSPSEAHKLAVKIEPKLIIPMHFEGVGEKNALQQYLKEEGREVKPIEKLTLKKKDLDGKENEIVVLRA